MILFKLFKLIIFSTILLFMAVPYVAIIRLFQYLVVQYPKLSILAKEVF